MTWLRWKNGRQGTDYQKLCLFSFWRFDCYLLRMTVGAHVPPHIDPVPGKHHFRLNLVLREAAHGGIFVCRRQLVNLGPLHVFRSDTEIHSVSRVNEGTRWALSLGAAL